MVQESSHTHIIANCPIDGSMERSDNYLRVEFLTGVTGWWDLVRGSFTIGVTAPDVTHVTSVQCCAESEVYWDYSSSQNCLVNDGAERPMIVIIQV